MTVRYRELALSDLEQISQYLKPRSPAGAQTVLQAIYNAIEQIERHPYSAIETSVSGIRVLIIGRYRYKIFYALLRMTPSKSFIFDTRRVGLGRASRVDAARQIETAMRRRF
jgi:plasmid stabilization system protein ParE